MSTNRWHARFGGRAVIGTMALGVLVATSVPSEAGAQSPGIRATAAQPAALRDSLVVTTEWLKQHLNERDLVLLHVGGKKEYEAGHIPGARLLDADVLAPHVMDSLILELPESKVLHPLLESLGISDTSRIVVYFTAGNVPTATRAIFTLDAAGLGERVSLLDGGVLAWQRSGNALTKDAPKVMRGKLAPLRMQQRVVDAAFVQQHRKTPGYRIVDARAPVFYDGVQPGMAHGPVKLKGHVPGATNIPFTHVTAIDHTLKSADELTAIFKAAGVEQGDRVIAYCHVGLQGTAVVFAARTLGIDAVLYDGSFQDWSERALPVELR
jgi:thiosulfate/3-mercaptopyruvate sulfurtransferase